MGNLQGSENKKNATKTKLLGNKVKGKKSPVRELFKNQGTKKGKDEQVTNSSAVDLSSAGDSLVVTTESWRRVRELQCLPDGTSRESGEKNQETTSPCSLNVNDTGESSSEESVFTDPLLTPLYSVNSEYSDGKPCDGGQVVCSHLTRTTSLEVQEDRDAVEEKDENNGLTAESVSFIMIEGQKGEDDSTDAEATPPVSRRQTSTTSDSEASGYQGSTTPSISSFTVSKHRKVELQPSKCLLLSPTSPATSNVNAGKLLGILFVAFHRFRNELFSVIYFL